MAIRRSSGGVRAALISIWAVLGATQASLAGEPPASVIRPTAASASSSYNADMGPEKTIDGSGLDPNDGHSTLETAMWLSAAGTPLPAWIQYELAAPCALKEMWVWNSNQPMESLFGFGAKSVMVEYSRDGVKWTKQNDVEFARAPGTANYTHNTAVDLGGVTAKYVRLTIQSNWGGLLAPCGLSEVRFFTSEEPKTTIDDFEVYTNDSPNRLWETWIDGIGYPGQAGNGSGAIVGHDIWGRGTPYTTIAETTIVHGGAQSMPLYYNNAKPPFYSRTERTFVTPCNWSGETAGMLSLWFYGRSSNAEEPLYVALQDTAGKSEIALHTEPQVMCLEQWQEWTIDLGVFSDAGVNLGSIAMLCLGVGDPLSATPGGTGILCVDDIGILQTATDGAQSLPNDLVEVAGAPYASLVGLAAGSAAAQASQAQAVQRLGLPLEVKTRQTGIVLRLIPAGTFTMGSPTSEPGRDSDEGPQHQVTLTKPFYCGKFEVTQGQWQAVMGRNPSYLKNAGLDAPVEQVSWDDCQAFLKKLCQMEGVPEGTYRLLTEAEWEYACRAGTQTPFCYGNDLDASMANFNGNYPYGAGEKGVYRWTTVAVGSFRPNAWGLYDMHGNVWEWCRDWGPSSYASGSQTDPLGPLSGTGRVHRGGNWDYGAWDCRSANRRGSTPVLSRGNLLGFRLARTTP
jgi:formylglycine-generating enzyme required for sulfatase activity